ncbi:ankyrin repeat domain-containing protein 26-like [Suricata suricatta]|uniref:ankyrin repeat domain-containing protein 26-like n=1 Tax=Suricata suricatta TaxID=37032 RepID=UPI001155E72C|nr:ankyrin repeat domain-containing protein 26-like [Suricata suricatta]
MEIASLVYEDLIDIEKSHCEHLKKKVKKMKKEGNALEKELAEAKEVNSQLECQNMKLERDLCLFRFAFTQEGERSLAEKFFEKNMENLQRTQEQHTKEVETKLRPEMPVRSLHMQSIVKTQLNTVLGSQEEKQDLLHTNKMLQDEFATGTWETDTMKIPNQGKEKKGKERLEEDLESSCARLTTPVPDHDQSRTSRRDVELDVQKARNEKYCSQVKVKSELSSLKDKNEILSQQLAQVELKFSTLEIELQHTKDALREKTLVLERVQRDLSQRECQKKELEHMLQNEQSKVDKYIGNQESLKERISQLESVNMLLRQQLQDAYCNKAKEKEEVVIMILNHYQDIITKLQGESEKQGQRNKELIDECKHLRERMYQYEHQKAEREVSMQKDKEKHNILVFFNLLRANEDLEKSKLQLLLEKQQHRTYLTPLNVRSALEPPDVGNLRNTWVLHGNFTVSENLMTPTRNQRSSFDTYLTMVEKEFHKVLNREFEKAAVETAAECRRLLPLHSAGNPVRTEDLIAKATKEYVEILNKKYMI